MLRFQRGDVPALSELVRRHKTPIYNFILRLVRSPSHAEDLLQDVFLRVIQNAQNFQHEARFTTWVYTIARNLCVDHLRKTQHRAHPSLHQPLPGTNRNLEEQVAQPHFSASAERAAMSNELRDRILAAVDQLPDEQREVFLLREIAAIPFKQIAEMTATSENTVKSRMRYALERLQEALQEYEESTSESG